MRFEWNGQHLPLTFWKAFAIKFLVSSLNYHICLFIRVQLTILWHWFWLWLGAWHVTSHHLNQLTISLIIYFTDVYFISQHISHIVFYILGQIICADNIYVPVYSEAELGSQQPIVFFVNSLPSDAIWQEWFWSTMAQIMGCCLVVPGHYLNRRWLKIIGIHPSVIV